MKRYILFLTILYSFSQIISGQTTQDATDIKNIVWQEKQIQPGIKLRQCEKVMLFNYLQSISILEIDTAVAKVDIKIDYSKNGFHPVSVFGRRNKAIAAINGTYFMTTGANKYTPWHFIKIDRQKVSSTVTSEFSTRATGVFTVTNGKADISFWNQEKEAAEAGNASYALVCGPLLLDDGKECVIWQPDPTNKSGLNFIGVNPRSCIGMTNTGKLLIMTIDGRQPSRAKGFTLNQLQFFAKQIGCSDAMNLDGGGSSALYVAGESNMGIVNVPIDENIPGKERNVGNVLYITPRDSDKPFCVSGSVPGGLSENNLRLWIKADSDVNKSNTNQLEAPYVFDYTGYNDFVFQGVDANAKVGWEDSCLNDYPALIFDSASVLISKRKVSYSTIFSVNTLSNNGTVLGFDETGSAYLKPREYLFTTTDRVYIHDGSSSPALPSIECSDNIRNSFNIYSTSFGKKHDTFTLNGQEQLSGTTNYNTRDNIKALVQIGAKNTYPIDIPGRIESYFNGKLAEVIAFTDTLTDSEINRVASYLAVKYGITMTDPSFQYQSSTGLKWWNGGSRAFKPFSNFVTFVGRDDASGLVQMKSKGMGNQLSVPGEAMLTLRNCGSDMTNLYFLTAGSTADNLLDTEVQNGYKVMKRSWKFNCSTKVSLPTDLIFDLPAGLTFNESSLGVLIFKGTTYTYHPGIYNSSTRQLSLSSLAIPKSSQVFVVLDEVSNGIYNTNTVDSKIVYDSGRQLLYVANSKGEMNKLSVFSVSGNLVATSSSKIKTTSLNKGVYVVVLSTKDGKMLDRTQVLISK